MGNVNKKIDYMVGRSKELYKDKFSSNEIMEEYMKKANELGKKILIRI
jgi:RNase P subunit RPR2